MILIVMVNYILIRAETDMLPRAVLALANSFLIGMILILFGCGSKVVGDSEGVILKRVGMRGQSKVSKLELKALPTLRIRIGSLRYLDREATVIAYMAIIDYTIDLLLTF